MAVPKPISQTFSDGQIVSFWSRVQKSNPDECWLFSRTNPRTHYGVWTTRISSQTEKPSYKGFRAHRIAYYLATGDDPGNLEVLHTCDNPPCCNPAHLFKGTPADNMADKMNKGRGHFPGVINQPKGERHAMAKLVESQVYEIRELYIAAEKSIPQIAEIYGVSTTTIEHIAKGKTWRHLNLEPVSQSTVYRTRGDDHWMHKHPGKAKAHALANLPNPPKLTEAEVIEIRQLFDAGGISKYKLAKWFNTTKQNIKFIVERKTWTHLP